MPGWTAWKPHEYEWMRNGAEPMLQYFISKNMYGRYTGRNNGEMLHKAVPATRVDVFMLGTEENYEYWIRSAF
ncbi:hypothetical protein J27TS7_48110 [Paenibacillus dendritiformis]|nr:hypothetical protein J27TS7_48110 [Paenibacillus dendritiformis]